SVKLGFAHFQPFVLVKNRHAFRPEAFQQRVRLAKLPENVGSADADTSRWPGKGLGCGSIGTGILCNHTHRDSYMKQGYPAMGYGSMLPDRMRSFCQVFYRNPGAVRKHRPCRLPAKRAETPLHSCSGPKRSPG